MRISFGFEVEHPRPHAIGRHQRSTPAKDLFVLLLVSLVLRVIFFCGYGSGDDAAYASEVNNILVDGYHDIGPDAVFLLRPITLAAIAASVRLFGWSETAFVLPILAASLVGIASTYLLGYQLYGRRAAILSAGALSLFPLDLVNSSTVTNDIVGSAFVGLGCATILRGFRRPDGNGVGPAIIGGVLVGLSTAVKLNFLLIVIPLAASLGVAATRGHITRSAGALVMSGWLFAQSVLGLFCWVKAGDPLAFVTFEMDFNRDMMERHYRPELLSSTLLFYPRMMFRFGEHGYGFEIFPLGWFFLAAFGTLVLSLGRRIERLSLPAGWFLFLVLAMQFWPLQWVPYVPIHRLPRFLHIAAIPGALLIGGVVGQLLQRGRRHRKKVFAAIAAYAVASLVHSQKASAHHNDCMADPRQLAHFVDWYDGPVFTDPELHYYLEFSKGFSDTARFRTPLEPLDQIWTGSLVIVGGSRKPEVGPANSLDATPIPRDWIRVFQLKTPMGPCRLEPAIGYIARKPEASDEPPR
jgi:4-amino-4-deoxy-L-arabinose transferase-like glycosyltransferase